MCGGHLSCLRPLAHRQWQISIFANERDEETRRARNYPTDPFNEDEEWVGEFEILVIIFYTDSRDYYRWDSEWNEDCTANSNVELLSLYRARLSKKTRMLEMSGSCKSNWWYFENNEVTSHDFGEVNPWVDVQFLRIFSRVYPSASNMLCSSSTTWFFDYCWSLAQNRTGWECAGNESHTVKCNHSPGNNNQKADQLTRNYCVI